MDIRDFIKPMQSLPTSATEALNLAPQQRPFPPVSQAKTLFSQWPEYRDQVLQAEDGRYLVTCTTEMTGVSAAMIDWWFGWHLTDSARYKLWHPQAHKCAKVQEDRADISDDRSKYIGNVSYVDETIGDRLHKLAIAFYEPQQVGLEKIYDHDGTAICARTSARSLAAEAGDLVHLIMPTDTGCEMRSAFWLGEFKLNWPLLGNKLTPLLNQPSARAKIIGPHGPKALQRHCYEEMQHLASFLPDLYRRWQQLDSEQNS